MKSTQPKLSLLVAIREIFSHLSPARRRQVLPLIGLMLLGALAELVSIGAILPFLALLSGSSDTFLGGALVPVLAVLPAGPERIVWLTGLFGLAALAAAALRLWLLWVQQNFVFGVSYDLGVELFRRTIYQPYAYHTSHNSSEILASVNKAQIVTSEVLLPLMGGVSSAVIALFIVLGLVAIDPLVALAAGLGFGVIYILVLCLTRSQMRANSKVIAAAQGERVQFMREGLGGVRDVILDRSQEYFIDKMKGVERKYAAAGASSIFLAYGPRLVIESLGMILIAAIAVTLSRGTDGLLGSVPILGALALGAQRLLPLMQQVYYGLARTAGNQQLLQDLLALLAMPLRDHLVKKPIASLPFRHSIRLRNVSFTYGSNLPPVLSGVTLDIRKGDRLGIVGATGSGKSTLMDLILGLIEPTEGEIIIDENRLNYENIAAWQQNIAHVPQSIYLADATIAENVAFGVDPDQIDHKRVAEAIERAALTDVVDSLPQHLETRVGERGVRLSGGQRQRVGIARALYKGATVLIFDEATSALDNYTEGVVMESISKLSRDLTILLIAHRISTLDGCDSIYTMSN